MSDQPPQVKVKENGPYIVTGGVPLRRKEPVISEHGEPLTWIAKPVTDDGAAYALCRCGDSNNKPYCDGTHAANEFDGTEAAVSPAYEERRTSHPGTGIEMFDDRGTCVHAGFCGNQVTNVWKMAPKTDDTTVRSQMMAMIERCPSGALTYEVAGEAVEPDLPVEISVIPDGPIWVSGGVAVERADGEAMEVRNRVTLCRCGQSGNKPLCDGSHTEAGFTG